MHSIDASHATVKYPSGHRLIKVTKIITQTDDETEIVADAEHQTNCISCGYDCSLTPQICAQRKRLDRANKLPCFHRGALHERCYYASQHFANLEQVSLHLIKLS